MDDTQVSGGENHEEDGLKKHILNHHHDHNHCHQHGCWDSSFYQILLVYMFLSNTIQYNTTQIQIQIP